MKKKWTKEELIAQWKDDRELKSFSKRKPKKRLSYKAVLKETANQTGFKIKDVTEVVDALIEVLKTGVENKSQVRLGSLFTIYPIVKKARQGTLLKGGAGYEQMIVPPTWEMRFRADAGFAKKIKNLNVTEEEVEFMFKVKK